MENIVKIKTYHSVLDPSVLLHADEINKIQYQANCKLKNI